MAVHAVAVGLDEGAIGLQDEVEWEVPRQGKAAVEATSANKIGPEGSIGRRVLPSSYIIAIVSAI